MFYFTITCNNPFTILDVCVPCFTSHQCTECRCDGTMSLLPNQTKYIVVVTEQGIEDV